MAVEAATTATASPLYERFSPIAVSNMRICILNVCAVAMAPGRVVFQREFRTKILISNRFFVRSVLRPPPVHVNTLFVLAQSAYELARFKSNI